MVAGAAPHFMHHVGLLAGTFVLGASMELLFAALSLAAGIPQLRRIYLRSDRKWRAPVVAGLAFGAMFWVSALVAGHAVKGPEELEGNHAHHHGLKSQLDRNAHSEPSMRHDEFAVTNLRAFARGMLRGWTSRQAPARLSPPKQAGAQVELVMLLASGRDADVYAYGEDLVLRRYRDGRSAEPEAATIRDLVAAGYPAPQIKYVRGPDMVMERVQGPSLAEAVLAGLAPEEAGATLAALHDRLHALPWPTAGPGESLVHLDLHPLNVLVRRTEPVVIDWANARPGDPSLDVALTALILAQVVVTEGMLASVQLPEDASRTTVLRMLGAFCHSICTGYQDQIAAAAVLRREDPNLTSGERNCLSTAVEVVRSIG